jgi:hypothetical protein
VNFFTPSQFAELSDTYGRDPLWVKRHNEFCEIAAEAQRWLPHYASSSPRDLTIMTRPQRIAWHCYLVAREFKDHKAVVRQLLIIFYNLYVFGCTLDGERSQHYSPRKIHDALKDSNDTRRTEKLKGLGSGPGPEALDAALLAWTGNYKQGEPETRVSICPNCGQLFEWAPRGGPTGAHCRSAERKRESDAKRQRAYRALGTSDREIFKTYKKCKGACGQQRKVDCGGFCRKCRTFA